VVVHGTSELGEMLVKITEPCLDYLVIKLNDRAYALRHKETLSASPDDSLTVQAVKTNLGREDKIRIRANGDPLAPGMTRRIREITGANGTTLKIDLTRGELPVGEVCIEIL
jgi:hypothetical protein